MLRGDFMEIKDLVIKIMNENNGILTSKDAAKLGIDNKILQRMHKSGEIERIEHGIYMNSNQMEDEYLLTQYRCKRGIFSHETALFFHDLSDRTPFQLMLTIPSGYNTRLLKDKQKYKFYYIKEDLHSIG
jgi:predicted transcriptional regulator of viral defense system